MTPQKILNNVKLIEQNVLVAVSGGVDSMVLLDALYRTNISVFACYIDHRQRPGENEKEKRLIQQYCTKRNITFIFETIDLTSYEEGQNRQAFFREQRYNLLERRAKELKITTIATGHHQNDQAETQLMRLIKNYDVMSYSGIVASKQISAEVKLIRPLLNVRKADIMAYAKMYDVTYAEDSSNEHNIYFRNRIRHQLVPIFEEENQHFVPEFIEKMTDFVAYQTYLQDELQRKMVVLLSQTNVIPQSQFMVFFVSFNNTIQKLIIRVLLQRFLGYDGKIKQEKIKEIIACLLTYPKKTKIMLDEHVSMGIQYDKIFLLTSDSQIHSAITMRLTIGQNNIGSYQVICSREEAIASYPWTTIILPACIFETGIYFRFPQQNDYLPLKRGKKKLNRLYIDEKVLPHERFQQPVLVTTDSLVIYDVTTKKIGFFDLDKANLAAKEARIYLHIKKKIET